MSCVSAAHNVSGAGTWLAEVSTIVETSVPEREILPGLQLLGNVVDKFVSIEPLYEPTEDGTTSNIFISKSFDASSHFESVVDDVS